MRLLSCPECGNDCAELSYDGKASVMCGKCKTATRKYATIREAVLAWNGWSEYAGMFAESQSVINRKIAG
ncbi:MAG: hypothetical protein IJR27_04510 [Synergistaceae bacterium]|nr:hypothetical protein [Synergistaceae bacterium]